MNQSGTQVRKRIALLLLFVLLLVSSLITRLIYLQVFKAEWLRKLAEDQRFRAITILPCRGTVYDRLRNELAISIDSDCVYAVPAEIPDPALTARCIAPILGLESQKLQELLTKRTSFVWLKRKVYYQQIVKLRQVIKEKRLSGIEVCQKAQRFYPQTSLAAQILGIAGIDNQGLEGLERYFDHYLRGIPGNEQAEYDTTGHHIPQGERRYVAPTDGDSIVLTIDQNIQYIMERELERAVGETNSKRGMALAVDPQTGEILGLANRPKFDPNKFNEYPVENRRNAVFTDMYEPGSTFKIITAAAALEEGKVTPESTFSDPGFIVVGDRRLKCWKAGGHGNQNFVQAMENSCNPVFATLALRLTKETFYKYIKAFGYGSTTGVDFPGESAGQLQSLTRVRDVELATIGFGQGITVTPIQMAMAVSAVANGGYLLKPRLVKAIYTPDGKLRKEYQRQVVRQVISKQTANVMCQLMQSVVANGSGNKAYLEGYRVAGKTGTAQKVVPGMRGYSAKRIASFIGFAPADNPKILMLVILDEPNAGINYGGVIAAPVVGNIFRDVLRYLEVKPRHDNTTVVKEAPTEVIVPKVLQKPMTEAVALLRQEGLDSRLLGAGNLIYDQIPRPGTKVAKGTKILLYLNPHEKEKFQDGKVIMPDLQGLTLVKAKQILNELGLQMVSEGDGVVVNQSLTPGVSVARGTVIKLNLEFNPPGP